MPSLRMHSFLKKNSLKNYTNLLNQENVCSSVYLGPIKVGKGGNLKRYACHINNVELAFC